MITAAFLQAEVGCHEQRIRCVLRAGCWQNGASRVRTQRRWGQLYDHELPQDETALRVVMNNSNRRVRCLWWWISPTPLVPCRLRWLERVVPRWRICPGWRCARLLICIQADRKPMPEMLLSLLRRPERCPIRFER